MFTAYFTMLSGLVFTPVAYHICQPVSTQCEWFMLLNLFAQLTYVSLLHWIGRFCYYGFLINECIDLILVTQTFHPSTHCLLYI